MKKKQFISLINEWSKNAKSIQFFTYLHYLMNQNDFITNEFTFFSSGIHLPQSLSFSNHHQVKKSGQHQVNR